MWKKNIESPWPHNFYTRNSFASLIIVKYLLATWTHYVNPTYVGRNSVSQSIYPAISPNDVQIMSTPSGRHYFTRIELLLTGFYRQAERKCENHNWKTCSTFPARWRASDSPGHFWHICEHILKVPRSGSGSSWNTGPTSVFLSHGFLLRILGIPSSDILNGHFHRIVRVQRESFKHGSIAIKPHRP